MAARDLIFHNFWLKLLSLVLAVMVYFVVHEMQRGQPLLSNYQRGLQQRVFRNVPVRLIVPAESGKAYTASPSVAVVTLGGSAAVLGALVESNLTAYVDAANASGAVLSFSCPIQVHLPPGVVLIKIEPAQANVRVLDR